jgi:hypothetical protein
VPCRLTRLQRIPTELVGIDDLGPVLGKERGETRLTGTDPSGQAYDEQ